MKASIPLDSLTTEKADKLRDLQAIVQFKYNGKMRRGTVESFDEHVLTLHEPHTRAKGETEFTKDSDEYKSFSLEKIESVFIDVIPPQ